MTTYTHTRSEGNKLTYPEGLKNFLAMSSPTVSPTYDLLYGYSEADGSDAKRSAPKSPMNGLDTEEHHEVWKQINQAHEGLVAQRAKEKGDPGTWCWFL